MTKGDAQRKRKESRDTSRADTTDLWGFEEVVLLAKPWKGVQLTQLHKLSWAEWSQVQRSCMKVTCQGEMVKGET